MKRELKININIERDGEVVWIDYALGDTESFSGMFEEAEMIVGKMSRHLQGVLDRDFKDEEYE